jgi:hypothetical protein
MDASREITRSLHLNHFRLYEILSVLRYCYRTSARPFDFAYAVLVSIVYLRVGVGSIR